MATFTKRIGKKINIVSYFCSSNARKNCRYYLELIFRKNPKDLAIVIMMNPATTAKQHIFANIPLDEVTDVDATTRNVIKCLCVRGVDFTNEIHNKHFDRIIFLNLIPYYSKDPSEIIKVYNNLNIDTYKANKKMIENTIRSNTSATYFCGWCKITSDFVDQEDDIRDLLKSYNIFPFYYDESQHKFDSYNLKSKNQMMCHASRWK